MKIGIKHLIECHCELPLFKDREEIIYHKILVYSKFDESGKVIEKFTTCENCSTIHKVHDICKSDIVKGGKDDNKSEISIEELELQIPDKLIKILRKNNCIIPIYEEIIDLIENDIRNCNVVINRELIEGSYHVKILNINQGKFKIINEKINNDFSI
jgi:hypothetical protein